MSFFLPKALRALDKTAKNGKTLIFSIFQHFSTYKVRFPVFLGRFQ